MRSFLRSTVPAGLLLLAEVAVVAVLHRLGSVPELRVPTDDLGAWLGGTDPEVVLAAIGRLVALVLAWWLLASTVLYALVRTARRDALASAIAVLTIPAARRMLDRSVAGALLAGALLAPAPAAPAGASPPPVVTGPEHRSGRLDPAAPLPEEVRAGRPAPSPTETTPAPTPAPAAPPTPPAPATPSTPPPPDRSTAPPPRPPAGAGTYVVDPGDNLWVIAARQVAGPGRSIASVPAAEIAPYWHRLIERNGARLRSGDPNLIFPGEVIELPSRAAP